MPNFETYQSVDLAPGWLRDEWGTALLGGLGARKDAHVALLKEAAKCGAPSLCPADALGLLGAERGIDRGLTESEASYRVRVKAAWDIWRWAGTPYGLLAAFYWAGYRPTSGKVILQTQGDSVAGGHQYELRADFDPAVHAPEDAVVVTSLGVVHLGGAPAELWQDFGVFFVPPLPTAWDPSPPADGSLEVNGIRSLITRWKPGHERCVVLKALPGLAWGIGSHTWGDGSTWGQGASETVWTPPT
jgi:hypothetical protein